MTMVDIAFYFATREIAERCGKTQNRFVITDGRYVLDNADLDSIRLTSDEYITGLQGIERVDKETALAAIKANGSKMGYQVNNTITTEPTPAQELVQEEAPVMQEEPETQEENPNEQEE